MLTLIATLIALISINAQSHDVPDRFTEGMLDRGVPVLSDTFTGMEWSCGDETCFAGYEDGKAVTGP